MRTKACALQTKPNKRKTMNNRIKVSYVITTAMFVNIALWLVCLVAYLLPNDWLYSWYFPAALGTLIMLFGLIIYPACLLAYCVCRNCTIEDLMNSNNSDTITSDERKPKVR
jgi:hypothetical protein